MALRRDPGPRRRVYIPTRRHAREAPTKGQRRPASSRNEPCCFSEYICRFVVRHVRNVSTHQATHTSGTTVLRCVVLVCSPSAGCQCCASSHRQDPRGVRVTAASFRPGCANAATAKNRVRDGRWQWGRRRSARLSPPGGKGPRRGGPGPARGPALLPPGP
jgi:hypothetical protein